MPRAGKPNQRPTWRNQYSEHDFRAGGGSGSGNNERRVIFKTNRIQKRNGKDWATSVRAHLDDEDIDMGASSGAGRTFINRKFVKGKKGSRGDSPVPHQQGPRKLLEWPLGWYKVELPYGNNYQKDFVLRTLMQRVEPAILWPVMWRTQGTSVSFYLDDFKCAAKLRELDRQIQMPDGFKMKIWVRQDMPKIDFINPDTKEKIKLVMAKRYNAATKALDLTNFHSDPDLQDCFCALSKKEVLLTIIDIIAENIPELEAVNLGENKIVQIFFLKKINEKIPNLKILHMGNNKFRDISVLDPLIGLPIVELVLNGNPLCSKFKDQDSYICEVRKRFPKVIKLDGVDLPPPITFDVADTDSMPPTLQTFLCNQAGELIVRQFLELYIQIFDSDNRHPLCEAYHEMAMFSMTTHHFGQRDRNLNWYKTDNRNLKQVTDAERRNKLLKRGRDDIVTFLKQIPASRHDIHSFTVDLVVFTPQMLCLTVTGLFKEVNSGLKVAPIRYFFRTLVIVPAGSGFCISNETLHVMNATEDQEKNSFKTAIISTPPTPVSSPVVSSVGSPVPDSNTKQHMLQAMSEQSGMNLEWSGKCLEEMQWDFTRALEAFNDLHKKGGIPPQAFVK